MKDTAEIKIIECAAEAFAEKGDLSPEDKKRYLDALLACDFYRIRETSKEPLPEGAFFLKAKENWREEADRSLEKGCRIFCGSIRGRGGMIPTESLLSYLLGRGLRTAVKTMPFEAAYNIGLEVFQDAEQPE